MYDFVCNVLKSNCVFQYSQQRCEGVTEDDDQDNHEDYPSTANQHTNNQQPSVSLSTFCDLECCESHRNAPFQTLTSKDINASKRKQGKQLRVFQKAWFKEHQWLTYCIKHAVVYCFYCRSISLMKGLTFSKRSDASFISRGFCNWKKGKKKFREHELSHTHNEGVLKWESLKQPSVMVVANSSLKRDQENRRRMLLVQIQCLCFLLRQGLAIRGHNDEGNLFQLMKMRAHDIPQLTAWLMNKKYQSPEIVNEQINLMYKNVLRSLITNIREQRFYGLIADETRDISGKEQLAICLRWVTDSYVIHEDLVGLAYVETTDASKITSVLQDCLLKCSIRLSNCRGQAYDGAANMAGHLNGVQAKILHDEPRAHYVHCAAHSLNLCLQECSKQSRPIRDTLALVNELSNFIRSSPKRLAQFEHIQSELSSSLPSLKPLCPTRWTVRTSAILSVIKNYRVLQDELDALANGSDESASKASGILTKLEQFC